MTVAMPTDMGLIGLNRWHPISHIGLVASVSTDGIADATDVSDALNT